MPEEVVQPGVAERGRGSPPALARDAVALGYQKSAHRRATWAYRLIEFVDTDGEPWFSMHEVHFSADGKPTAYTDDPAAVCSETPEGLAWVLDRMREALSLPALREIDFGAAAKPSPHGNSGLNK